jgi:antitoxin FitA
MTLRIELPEEQERALREMAAERGIPVEEFARLKLVDVASGHGKNFRAAADYVMRKNLELFKRLS